MQEILSFKCDHCDATFLEEDIARAHETGCRRKSNTAKRQAGIRARWNALKKECTHPNQSRDKIPDVAGDNFNISCPDCGFKDSEFDISR